MAKKTTIEGYTIALFVPVDHLCSAANAQQVASEVRAEIRAHILPRYRRFLDGAMDIEAQLRKSCEHCGHHWTEDSSTYNGGCCEADEAANPTPAEVAQ